MQGETASAGEDVGIALKPKGHAKYLWYDGQIRPWEEATVHVTHIGVAGISHVFEGIKAYWDKDAQQLYVICLEQHMHRFAQSMKIMRMNPQLPIGRIGQGVVDLLRANEERRDIYIRPFAFRNEPGPLLSNPRIGGVPTIVIYEVPFTSTLESDETLSCCISSWTRISDNVLPVRVKAAVNYRNGQLANAEAELNGYDKPILLDIRGKVSESSGACLMIVRDGVVITPPVTASILESVTRRVLIQLFREALSIEVMEREVDRTELYIADEAFLCGTGAEVGPITSIDRLPVGSGQMGPITKEIRALYRDVVRGIDPRYKRWGTPVWG